MLSSKVKDFVGENKNDVFPDFTPLNKEELNKHKFQLKKVFECHPDMPVTNIYRKIVEASILIPNVNAKYDEINIYDLLVSQNINPDMTIYIDWLSFDDVDRMELSLFTKYFDDIWYPGADDIYDKTFSWFLHIAHYGAITITKGIKKA